MLIFGMYFVESAKKACLLIKCRECGKERNQEQLLERSSNKQMFYIGHVRFLFDTCCSGKNPGLEMKI